MLIKTNALSRRKVLNGMLHGGAVAVSIPFLDMFLNENGTAFAATGQPLPNRFGTWFWGLGVDPKQFIPTTFGKLPAELPVQLSPLQKQADKINVFSNFDVLTDGAPNLCHYSGWVALRTGSAPQGRNGAAGASIDVPIIDAIGGGTRFKQINLAATGNARDSYSFTSPDAVNPPEVSAIEFYTKIFGPEFQDPNAPTFTPSPKIMMRKSVLSGVTEQRKDFERGLGAADRARMDQYYTSIREIENRLALQLEKPPAAPDCKAPAGQPGEIARGEDVVVVRDRHRAMTDLLMMALVCNQSKVFNVNYSSSGSNHTRKGLDKSHHAYTHEEPVNVEKGYQINSFEFVNDAMREFGYFIDKMAATKEGDGNLLDRAMVYAHSDCQIAKVHSLTNVPMITAGNFGGKLKTGLHIDGKAQAATQLGYTLQLLAGVPIDKWGTKSMTVRTDMGAIVNARSA